MNLYVIFQILMQTTFNFEEYKKNSEDEKIKYEKLKQEIAKVQENSKKTLASLDHTLIGLQQATQAAAETQQKIENFKKCSFPFIQILEFGDALNGLANRLSESMQPAFLQIEAFPPAKQVNSLQEVIEKITQCSKIVFLTGAGLSAASGIPTFRGKGGFWTSGNDTYEAQRVLTYDFFESNNELCWKWHRDFQNILKNKAPNKSHEAIAELNSFFLNNKGKKEMTLVTQNIDNLHVRCYKSDFSKKGFHNQVYEIHGNIKYMRCNEKCSENNEGEEILYDMPDLNENLTPSCPRCGKQARPHILFFDEAYNEDYYRKQSVLSKCEQADGIIVIGTKLETGLSAGIVSNAVRQNKLIVEINPESTIKCGNAYVLNKNAEDAVPQLCNAIKQDLNKSLQKASNQKQEQMKQTGKKESKTNCVISQKNKKN